jgi:hypothetical protein
VISNQGQWSVEKKSNRKELKDHRDESERGGGTADANWPRYYSDGFPSGAELGGNGDGLGLDFASIAHGCETSDAASSDLAGT